MSNTLVLIAAGIFLATIIFGSITANSWKNTIIAWILLLIGVVVFGIALTL